MRTGLCGGITVLSPEEEFGGGGSQTNNPNCITNILPKGKATNRENYDVSVGHDGMHVYSESEGKQVNLTAVSAMVGTIKRVRAQGDDLFRIDILLANSINGESYYLIFKDLTDVGSAAGGNRPGARNIRIRGNEVLGKVRGEVTPPSVDYKGAHVTMISAKNYTQLSQNIRDGVPSPKEWLMNAATDKNSPFRCL
jgi:hypothetical protein